MKTKNVPYGLKCKINPKKFFKKGVGGVNHLGKIPKKYRFFWTAHVTLRSVGKSLVFVLQHENCILDDESWRIPTERLKHKEICVTACHLSIKIFKMRKKNHSNI